MVPDTYLLSFIALSAMATFLTRALPFLLFSRQADHPLLQFLGRYLPPVLMVLLVIYALKTPLVSGEGLVQSVLALLTVVGLHLLLRNALVSILGGTFCYMWLVQTLMPLG
ncbi:branched-chain amino acid transporter permease [Marinobacterium sp. YM272]|uniref:branched-chain amino acid transporter permease n=1 Tax=Marinobacterium sp. YM272 TaxID=3421654 RepID=UPI003D7FCA51